MLLPFLIFWVLIFLGRSELGGKGILISIGIWIGLLLGFALLNISPYIFVGATALLDIILILVIFGGDIQIR